MRNSIKSKDKIKDLALFLLSNAGNLVSSYSLEKTLGISDGEISRYMKFLEEAYLLARVPLFSYSVKKRIYNPDKVYCVDTGLVNMAGFSFSENKGRLLENIVYAKLSKEKDEVFYWKNGTEIDLLTFNERKVKNLINITLTVDDPKVLERELSSLDLAGKVYPRAQQKLFCLYNQSNQQDPRVYPLLEFLS